ncbi:MAG: DUF6159 family protein [Anaerolineales bacterium]|jgi:hypothetical protein
MFERLSNSWALVKASASVLRADKELVIFPIISSIGVLVVSASFALPMFFGGLFDAMLGGRLGDVRIATFIIAFLFYFSQYVVIVFSNAALIGAAMIRLDGGDPTVGDGFRIAFDHLGAIIGYALIASTVGMLLRAISNRSDTLGRIAVSLVGLAWNLATFLVVPVLVVEGQGPLDSIRRSASLLKRTWGEQIAGNLSIGLIFGLISFGLAVVLIAPAAYVAANFNQPLVLIPVVLVLILAIVLISLISSTLQGIYAAAVYRFATDGDAGPFFRPELVQGAFRGK